MKVLLKILVVTLILAVTAGALHLWFQTYVVGRYYASAGMFLVIMGAAWPVIVAVAAFFAVKKTVTFNPDEIVGQ